MVRQAVERLVFRTAWRWMYSMRRSGACSLLLALAMVVGCGGGGPTASSTPPPGPIAQDLPSLVQAAPLIIVGKVAEIQAGRTAGLGNAKMQFNDVRVSVEKRLKGGSPSAVVVEQADTTGRVFTSEVGPAYKVGERYVLFLRPGEGDRHVTVTQGRYLLSRGSITPVESGPAGDSVKGMDEGKFIQAIEAIV